MKLFIRKSRNSVCLLGISELEGRWKFWSLRHSKASVVEQRTFKKGVEVRHAFDALAPPQQLARRGSFRLDDRIGHGCETDRVPRATVERKAVQLRNPSKFLISRKFCVSEYIFLKLREIPTKFQKSRFEKRWLWSKSCKNWRDFNKKAKQFDEFLNTQIEFGAVPLGIPKCAKECQICRSRKMLQNEYLVAKSVLIHLRTSLPEFVAVESKRLKKT